MENKLFTWAKSLHRFLVPVIITLSFLMIFTGLILRFPYIASAFPFLDYSFARYLHNNLSPFFALTLFLMMLAGAYMYWFLYLRKRS